MQVQLMARVNWGKICRYGRQTAYGHGLLGPRFELALLGVTFSAGGSQDRKHFLGYLLHVRCLARAADNEVETGEAEAEEVS
jgi:hypothetical protein